MKHNVPGNNTISHDERSKFGARKNRYGVFNQTEPSDFEKVVKDQLQKERLDESDEAVLIESRNRQDIRKNITDTLNEMSRGGGLQIDGAGRDSDSETMKH